MILLVYSPNSLLLMTVLLFKGGTSGTESRKGVDGVVSDRVFISDRVSNDSNFIPHVGDTVLSFAYNKFGKLSRVIVE